MSSASPPGWHPDPGGDAGMLRWWDGNQWTEHRHPAPGGGGATGVGTAGSGAGGPSGDTVGTGQAAQQGGGSSPYGYGTAQSGGQPAPPYGGPGPYGQSTPYGQQGGWGPPGGGWGQQQPYGGRGPYGGRRGRGMGRTRGPNSFSWTAIGFSVAYVILAFTTGFVLLGIVPVMSSVRAYQRREKLAPVAVAAAVITVATAIFVITGHRRYY